MPERQKTTFVWIDLLQTAGDSANVSDQYSLVLFRAGLAGGGLVIKSPAGRGYEFFWSCHVIDPIGHC